MPCAWSSSGYAVASILEGETSEMYEEMKTCGALSGSTCLVNQGIDVFIPRRCGVTGFYSPEGFPVMMGFWPAKNQWGLFTIGM